MRKPYFLRSAVMAAIFLLVQASWCAETAAARAAKAGELVTLKHHKILRLFGKDIKERGFAHGYLLAAEIRDCMEDALKSLPLFSAEKFAEQVAPWAKKNFVWDESAKLELEGLFQGVRARLSDTELVCPVLKRAMTLDDLYGINVIADWFGPACSGFTAWGTLTGGPVVHGRNLDFPIGKRAVTNQVVLASAALMSRGKAGAQKAWIGVGWPGLITQFSAMNEDGLVCNLHDATNVAKGGVTEGFVARGLLLRRIVEAVDPEKGDAATAAAALAERQPVSCGNLFHLAWPKQAAVRTKTVPCAVLEFDAADRGAGQKAVFIRRPEGEPFCVLTNHYCLRRAALDCKRYSDIHGVLANMAKEGTPLGVPEARKVLIAGELALAAHTLVFLPDERTLHVALTRGNFLSTRTAGALFTFAELQARSGVDP